MDKRQRWNERYASSGLTWSAGPNALFAEIAAEIVPGRALDAATGEGRNALWLANQAGRSMPSIFPMLPSTRVGTLPLRDR